MDKLKNKISIEKALSWVEEARYASDKWRQESWADQEMYDGNQWSEEDRQRAIDSGIEPITINRTFPCVNLILGSQELNKASIVAKARTHRDGCESDLMTEAIAFILDQNDGQFLIQQAFKDAVVPGIGWLYTGYSNDPRREKLTIEYRDWKEVFFDPYSSAWLDASSCRYMFFQRWMDLFDLQCLYPDKRKELEEAAQRAALGNKGSVYGNDIANDIENDKRMNANSQWFDSERKRVRPVQMWYAVLSPALYAIYEDGKCIEIHENMPIEQIYSLMQTSQQIMKTSVRKLRVKTFLNDYEIEDVESPFAHNEYPFIPFIGYIDRFGYPYGVPRMIRGQNIEVNRRRSMNLALLSKRRMIMEEGATDDPQRAYEEANKIDGMIMLNAGGMSKTQLMEGSELSQYQMGILAQSEREIQEISGVNAESTGYSSNADSGKAITLRRQQSSMIMASVFGNYRRSLNRLGKILVNNVQSTWTAPKVLRITDKITLAEKFVEINQAILQDGSVVDIKNDITQGIYDIIISDAPATDTIREQNMQLLIEWTKQSPPELIPYLMGMAMEMSNLPNKDQLMMKLRPLMGITPEEMDMSQEELKKKMEAEMQQRQEQEQMQMQMQQKVAEATLEKMVLENEKLKADIQHSYARDGLAEREQNRKDFDTGIKAGERIREAQQADVAQKIADSAADLMQMVSKNIEREQHNSMLGGAARGLIPPAQLQHQPPMPPQQPNNIPMATPSSGSSSVPRTLPTQGMASPNNQPQMPLVNNNDQTRNA